LQDHTKLIKRNAGYKGATLEQGSYTIEAPEKKRVKRMNLQKLNDIAIFQRDPRKEP
jgi:hypothetical protein